MRRSYLLLFTLFITAVANAAPVQVVVSASGPFPERTETLSATLVAKSADKGEVTQPGTLTFQVPVHGKKTIELEPGRWQLLLKAKGTWCDGRALLVEGEENHVRFAVWPTGTLQARLGVPKNQSLPEALMVRFEPEPAGSGSDHGPEGTVSCVPAEESWSCQVPAGRLDLRLSADNYVSRYLWGIEVRPGKPTELGVLNFKHGSSVSGWVVTEDGRSASGTQIVLRPRSVDRPPGASAHQRLQGLNLATKTNDRGFFQIDRISPGAYVIEAAKDPYAPARATVRILEGEETVVDRPPLVLHPLQAVEVYVQPPIPPGADHWLIEVAQLNSRSQTLHVFDKAAVSLSGTWTSDAIPPGRYRFTLQTEEGGSRWLRHEVEIEPNPAPVFLDLEITELRGSVLFGGEPLLATLLFSEESGPVRITIDTDEKGRFNGFLPHPGIWKIDITGVDQPVKTNLREVEIRKRPGKTYAEVVLRLPNTRLDVTVVNEHDVPFGKAIVTASSHAREVKSLQEFTDKDGKVEIFGLPPGSASLIGQGQVNERSFTSDEVLVHLQDDGEPEEVRLMLRPELVIYGQVVAGDRGIPGAQIKAVPVLTRSRLISMVATDASGSFTIRLPSDTTAYDLSVAAPGFGYQFLRLQAAPDEPLRIPVSEESGTLIVTLPEDGDSDGLETTAGMLYHHGGREFLNFMRSWVRFHGESQIAGTMRIPRMSPGDYVVCLSHKGKPLPIRQGPEMEDLCVGGFLPAGGVLELSLAGTERE